MEQILIIEDNKEVNKILAEAVQLAGYKTNSVFTGLEGIKEIKQNTYHLVLLDIMLPYKSGDEVLKEIRSFSIIPIIIISAKDLVSTKVDLLKLGADDYITKPFDLNEVIARISATLRRYHQIEDKESTIKHGNIIIHRKLKKVLVNNNELKLTAKEYLIIELLFKNKDKIFTKANLYSSIWGQEYMGDDNAIKTHISNVRNKIKKYDTEYEYIETVWGLGYRINNQI